MSLLFLLLITQFLFFPWVGVGLSRGYAALAQACLWEYRSTAKLTWSASSQAVWVWATGSLGTLLVSPFNMKWRFSEPAGGVEGSKFCLFSVILPAKCVSSVSPRFHYRRLAFCFLPLAAILESSEKITSYVQVHFIPVMQGWFNICTLTEAKTKPLDHLNRCRKSLQYDSTPFHAKSSEETRN
jgi:hypothetical protein